MRRKWVPQGLCLVLEAVFVAFSLLSPALLAAQDVAVIGYLPSWRYEGCNWDEVTKHVSHLLLFSLEPTADGSISDVDRLPRPELLAEARAAAKKHGTYLMVSFGGNGRSRHFSAMARSKKSRKKFVRSVGKLLDEYSLDGIDLNWEYPGGFAKLHLMSEEEKLQAWNEDYKALAKLCRALRNSPAFHKRKKRALTMAYYPDTSQEIALMAPWMRSNHRQEHKTRTLLNWKGKPIVHWVDYMMAMVYDNANDPNGHSTFDFATSSLYNAQNALGGKIGPYWPRFCLGLPFYARKRDDSSWRSYEDIIQPQHTAVADNVIADGVRDDFYDDGGVWTFNSVSTIEKKSRWAIENGAGGLMIWEIGQDCRTAPIVRFGHVEHEETCRGDRRNSLLEAVTRGLIAAGGRRARRDESVVLDSDVDAEAL